MKKFLFNANATYFNFGLLFLRITVGASMIWFHGYGKISDPGRWKPLGENLDMIGINFLPEFWGFMAAFAEFFGAAFLILGLFTRISCLMLVFTMFIAFYGGYIEKDMNSYPLNLMLVFISIFIIGPGKFSLDAQINGFKK
ncbi:MAG: DoxX family protein [Fimbriimonadaceae bacterium]|nr:DoxX family protein [Chitinophagales bacterium]